MVDFANSHLSAIPTNFGSIFPNVSKLIWEKDQINILQAIDLELSPNLVELWFFKNQLTSLESGLFRHTRKLQRIDFRMNRLLSVGPNLLTDLKNLNTSDFSYNDCTQGFLAAVLDSEECSADEQIEDLTRRLGEQDDAIISMTGKMSSMIDENEKQSQTIHDLQEDLKKLKDIVGSIMIPIEMLWLSVRIVQMLRNEEWGVEGSRGIGGNSGRGNSGKVEASGRGKR